MKYRRLPSRLGVVLDMKSANLRRRLLLHAICQLLSHGQYDAIRLKVLRQMRPPFPVVLGLDRSHHL
jgi:hypothetical protein